MKTQRYIIPPYVYQYATNFRFWEAIFPGEDIRFAGGMVGFC
jgi:hypothetical protein